MNVPEPPQAPGWSKHVTKLRKAVKMIIGMTPKRFKEKPNHEKMMSQPLPSFMFVHLVAPFLFSLWSLIFEMTLQAEGHTTEDEVKRFLEKNTTK